jgi:magnesium chelatase family protein
VEFTAGGAGAPPAASSCDAQLADASARVWRARVWRQQRSGALCGRLSPSQLQACCALPPSAAQLLRRSAQQLALSGRGIHRLLAVGRTIADLDGSESIEAAHLAEAVQLRRALIGAYCARETM